MPLLPKWFALKGPAPYWLAENWSLIFAVVSGVLVLLNTMIAVPGMSVTTEKWVNAVIAWVASGALYLQGRQKKVMAIAEWRKKVRAEEAMAPIMSTVSEEAMMKGVYPGGPTPEGVPPVPPVFKPGYIEVSGGIPPASDEPLVSPPPLTDRDD